VRLRRRFPRRNDWACKACKVIHGVRRRLARRNDWAFKVIHDVRLGHRRKSSVFAGIADCLRATCRMTLYAQPLGARADGLWSDVSV